MNLGPCSPQKLGVSTRPQQVTQTDEQQAEKDTVGGGAKRSSGPSTPS